MPQYGSRDISLPQSANLRQGKWLCAPVWNKPDCPSKSCSVMICLMETLLTRLHLDEGPAIPRCIFSHAKVSQVLLQIECPGFCLWEQLFLHLSCLKRHLCSSMKVLNDNDVSKLRLVPLVKNPVKILIDVLKIQLLVVWRHYKGLLAMW